MRESAKGVSAGSTIDLVPISKIQTDKSYDEIDENDKTVKDLMSAIEKVGLINPISLNKDYKIITGRKRLHACIALGREQIEARFFDVEDPLDEELIELYENSKRKHLTWQEEMEAIDREIAIRKKQGIDFTQSGPIPEDKKKKLEVTLGTEAIEHPIRRMARERKKSYSSLYSYRKIWNDLDDTLKPYVSTYQISQTKAKDLSLMPLEDQQLLVEQLEDKESGEKFSWLMRKWLGENDTKLFRELQKIKRPGLEDEEEKQLKKKVSKEKEQPTKRIPFARNQLGKFRDFVESPPYLDEGWVIGIRFVYNSDKELFRIVFQLDKDTRLLPEQEDALKKMHDKFADVEGYRGCYTIEPMSFDYNDGYLINSVDKITPKNKEYFFRCTSKHKSLFD